MKKKRNLKILWSSNSPFSTSGYGQQMAEILPLLKKGGWKQAVSAFYGLEGASIIHKGIKLYPKIANAYGDDAMLHHSKDYGADCVISLQDIWVLDLNILSQLKNWIPIIPIDQDPIPQAIYDRAKLAYRIITMSKFGQKQLENKGMMSTYIPNTVDTTIFKPMDKIACKLALNLKPDTFLFGMVAANKDLPPRKSFQEVLDAFKIFHDAHPNSAMYFHTLLQQQGGFPIADYANHLGLNGAINFMDPYQQMFKVGKSDMAKIINSFDCLLSPSASEGFGVPIVEAQSCGVPVIVNRFTSMPELVVENKSGYICEVATKRWTALNSYFGIPDVKSLYDCMEKVYATDRIKMGKAGRANAIANYDSKMVYETMYLPFLEKIQDEILPTD